MNLPQFCIKRPVFATVLSLILVVIGIMGYHNIKTRFFPRFEPAKIFITAFYDGASAKLVESTVTTPLEKSISGIEGIDDTYSSSSQGSSFIKVELKPGVNVYDVTNKIRNQIAMAASSLPNTIQPPLVQIGHSDMDLMDIAFSIQGDKLNVLRDYLDRYVTDRIEQVPGISMVSVTGANKYAMRVTLHPGKMTAFNITVDDIRQAITSSNLQLPAGFIKTPTMNFPITAKTELNNATQFGNIVVKNNHGQLVYLKDIATVALGSDTNSKSIIRVNGSRAILLSVYNTDDANPIDASARVRHLLKNIQAQLPPNIHYTITFDQATYMQASITEVYRAIGIAILFVAMIIFLSLGKFRSALIPIVTIPICILATMGLMYFLGFSINIITLLAMVLSIGLVVDDSIVVLENCHRHLEHGMTRLQAAIQGSKEIATPVIAMTLTLAAVYAPIGLIQGPVAHIFESFAFTLAVAVIISGFVALTLSPMMCSKFLSPHSVKQNQFNATIENFFIELTIKYKKILSWVLSHRLKIIAITLFLVFCGFFVISALPKTFLPNEDMGFLVTTLHSESGTNNEFSGIQLNTLNQILSQQKDIQTNVSLSFEQASEDNNNTIFSTLKNYGDRHQSANDIAASVNQSIHQIPGLDAVSFPPSFGGSIHSQIEFYIMAPASYQYLYQVSNAISAALNQYPGLKNVKGNIQFNDQQYNLTVNRALANQLQVPISSIDNTIATLLGGSAVSNFDLNGQTYDVDVQAEPSYLSSVEAMETLTVASSTGKLIPLSNLISVSSSPSQSDRLHYDRLRAAVIGGELTPGYSMGAVVSYLKNALPTLLPDQVKFAFKGQARNIERSSNSMLMIFSLAFVFIYLVLSAQFESFVDPLIILLAVPLSIVGALVSLKLMGGSINLYTVIALVTLVGLIAKHGILITQFANKLQEAGKSAQEALVEAASIRLRPILMTTAAMVFGALPLLLATGASAMSREQVGVVFVSGLLFGTFFSLVLVPIAYSCFAGLKQWKWEL